MENTYSDYRIRSSGSIHSYKYQTEKKQWRFSAKELKRKERLEKKPDKKERYII